jgi:hypothetical protein
VIPRTLAQNCGANVIRTMTKLRAAHAESSEPRCASATLHNVIRTMTKLRAAHAESSEPRCASATPHARTRTGLLLAGEVEGGKREWTWWARTGGGNALAFIQPT